MQDDFDPIEKGDDVEDEMAAAGMHVVGETADDEDEDAVGVALKATSDDDEPVDGLEALDKAAAEMEIIPIDIGEEEDI